MLHYETSILLSVTGVQQGNPVDPASFSLGIDAVVRDVSELNVWFLDDATIGGSVEGVLADLCNIKDALFRQGLHIINAKCELIPVNCTTEEMPNIVLQFQAVLPRIRLYP